MNQNGYHLHVRKEKLKFSSAHMSVFPSRPDEGSLTSRPSQKHCKKEALHGHNYSTEVVFGFKDLTSGTWIPFAELKELIQEICDMWDEKVLLAREALDFEIKKESSVEVEFILCGKRYVLPRDEVEFLPVENTTVECLSREFCRRLVEKIENKGLKGLSDISVTIEEAPGQGCTFSWEKGALS